MREEMSTLVSVHTLQGQVFSNVMVDGDIVIFQTKDGKEFCMNHDQNCCESVHLIDIVGDIKDLIDAEIIRAEEITNSSDRNLLKKNPATDEAFLWTFYRIGSRKGTVVFRWLGESNGWYSVSVEVTRTR